MEKLSAFQVNSNELSMYSSVRSIGQKEKKIFTDRPINEDNAVTITVNAIAGGNKKKRKLEVKAEESDSKSIDTDDMSSDSDVDEVNQK